MAILCREVTPLEIAGIEFKWEGKLRMKLKESTPGGGVGVGEWVELKINK